MERYPALLRFELRQETKKGGLYVRYMGPPYCTEYYNGNHSVTEEWNRPRQRLPPVIAPFAGKSQVADTDFTSQLFSLNTPPPLRFLVLSALQKPERVRFE